MPNFKKVFYLSIALLFGCGVSAFAQEENFPVPQPEQQPEMGIPETSDKEGGIITLESDESDMPGLNVKESIVLPEQKNSASSNQQSTPRNQPKGSASENESVLSFNFIYYLIQKFKLSESVE